MFALKQAAILKIACAPYVFNMLQALGKFSRRIIFRWSQMYFLHHSCTFVRHNALILKKYIVVIPVFTRFADTQCI
jgi:hypothetical protein